MLEKMAHLRGPASKMTEDEFPPLLPFCCIVTAVAERNYPTSEVRGDSREELPHARGRAAARKKEGREELLHVQSQVVWP